MSLTRAIPMRRSRRGSTTSSLTILDAMDDSHLFASSFRDPESWQAWRAFLAVLFGLGLTHEQRELAKQCTGRELTGSLKFNEAWLVCGRRSGKSFTLALIAVYLACFKDWRPYLGPGERATCMVVATDRRQARVILRYMKGLISSVPMLARLVESETQESLSLSNRVTLEVHACSFRSTRGYSIVAALLDELAFWPTEDAADPDREVINAIRPGMATVPGAMLLCASSPHARKGALWDAYRRHFGRDDSNVLVWNASTRTMNPSVPENFIAQALEEDPALNTAEYLAQFRTDVEGYVRREAVEACISSGVQQRDPDYINRIGYSAFVDPSGGSSDSMTLAIGHRQDGIAVVDFLREFKPPFSPEAVVKDFCDYLKWFKVTKVTGDRYGGQFVQEHFRKNSISYEPVDKSKSDLYKELLPAINSRKVELLDNPKLINQLCSLERSTARGSGRDIIDHPRGSHDDLANACAGLVGTMAAKGSYDLAKLSSGLRSFVGAPDPATTPCGGRPNGWQHPGIRHF